MLNVSDPCWGEQIWIWKHPNQIHFFEGSPLNLDYIFVKIFTLMKEYGSTRPNHSNRFILYSLGPPCVRSKPRRSTLKINVDATLSPIYSSIDAVARDWRGEYIFCLLLEGKHQLPSLGES